MKDFFHRLITLIFFLSFTHSAFAAKLGTIEGDSAPLRGSPSEKGAVIEQLSKGSVLTISNLPVNGFFKVRTGDGKIGFVPAESVREEGAPPRHVDVPPPAEAVPETAPPVAAPEAPPAAATNAPEATSAADAPPPALETPPTESPPTPEAPPAVPAASPVTKSPARSSAPVGSARSTTKAPPPPKTQEYGDGGNVLALLGGYTLFASAGDLNTLIGSSVFTGGLHVGLQYTDWLNANIAFTARVEEMIVSSSNATYAFSASSTPIMVGIRIPLSEVWGASILTGYAVNTSVSALLTGAAGPNTTTITSGGFTQLLTLDLRLAVSHSWWFLGELGYRLLKTASVAPTQAVNGSSIFQSGGSFVPVDIDLSGPMASIGLAYSF